MPFALVATVRIDDIDKARDELHTHLIPGMKQAPGFVKGTWMADPETGQGLGIVLFDAGPAEALLPGPDNEGMEPQGVKLEHAAVYEVQGEA